MILKIQTGIIKTERKFETSTKDSILKLECRWSFIVLLLIEKYNIFKLVIHVHHRLIDN